MKGKKLAIIILTLAMIVAAFTGCSGNTLRGNPDKKNIPEHGIFYPKHSSKHVLTFVYSVCSTDGYTTYGPAIAGQCLMIYASCDPKVCKEDINVTMYVFEYDSGPDYKYTWNKDDAVFSTEGELIERPNGPEMEFKCVIPGGTPTGDYIFVFALDNGKVDSMVIGGIVSSIYEAEQLIYT